MWDRNNISPQGLQDVAAALEKNYTIRFMPVPIVDAAQALKANPEKTEDALLKVRACAQEASVWLAAPAPLLTTRSPADGAVSSEEPRNP